MIAAKMKRGMMLKDNAVNIVIKCVFKSEIFYELLNLK